VEFDLETLAPTYHLSIGLPGRSNAFAIAARLGLSPHIIKAARGMVDETDLHTEDLLAGIARAYQETLYARDETEAVRDQLREANADVEARLVYVEDERREVINEARVQARQELEQVRAEITEIRDGLRVAAVTLDTLEGLDEHAEVLAQQTSPEVAAPPAPVQPRHNEHRLIRVGDTVWVDALNASGQVTALEGGEAEVQAGRLRLRLKTRELEWQAPPPELEPSDEPAHVMASGPPQSPGIEVDLRGMTTEEALPRVDKHLDSASLVGLPWVRIIHGHGTGVLKRAVRDMLSGHPLVKSYVAGKPQEGGEGVTVAHMVSG
jgi:DNA mismatch repair protein MutS2